MTYGPIRIYRFANVEVHGHDFRLLRDGEAIPIEPKAFRVLLYLLQHPRRVVTKEELLDAVWTDVEVSENSLTRSIAILRRVLGDDSREPTFIATVPTVGYRFVAEVTVAGDVEAPAESAVAAASPLAIAVQEPQVVVEAMPAQRALRRRWWLIGSAAALAAAGGFVPFLLHRRTEPVSIRSLAVLPLENLSGDRSQDYLVDGMTDELTTQLARIPNLRVVPRNSVLAEKDTRKRPAEMARDLHVDAVVEGAVARSGDAVRITAALIDARQDRHLWADSFTGKMSDILSLEDDVARKIAAQANLAMTSTGQAARPKPLSIDPTAYDDYLRGRYLFDHRDVPRSAAYFEKAVALAPDYAPALAALADALESEIVWGLIPFVQGRPRTLALTQRAIALDPGNSEAYSVAGTIERLSFHWEPAERNLKQAIELNMQDALAELKYAIYLGEVNRANDAVVHMRRAVQLEPLSFFMNRHLGAMLYLARQDEEALFYLARAREIDPSKAFYVDNWVSAIYQKRGMLDKTVDMMYTLDGVASESISRPNADRLRETYRKKGWIPYLRARAKLTAANVDTYCGSYELATLYVQTRDLDQAFPLFERAIDEHCYELELFQADPLLDSIRADPRYHALLVRMDLAH